MSWNSTVTCSWCYKTGHNRRGCPDRRAYIANNPNSYEAIRQKADKESQASRKCTYCLRRGGHNRRTCPVLQSDRAFLQQRLSEARPSALQTLHEAGFGIGALVVDQYWDRLIMVTSISWEGIDCVGINGHDNDQIVFRGRQVGGPHARSAKECSASVPLRDLASTVLSATSKSGLKPPAGWADGTSFDESRWFDKKSSRDYFFREENHFSS